MKTKLPVIIRDCLLLAGAAAVVTGLSLVHLSLGFIVGGALLVVGAILAEWDSKTKQRQAERDRRGL
jgi:uncharacterized membrane protein AbrB (regulator of aidB expression)